jgi:hypothetical protein
MTPEIGKRVRLLAPMVNENSSWMPTEKGMAAGLEGTIVYLSLDGPKDWHQIGVQWDNGRTLNLLPHTDKFEVFEPEKEVTA